MDRLLGSCLAAAAVLLGTLAPAGASTLEIQDIFDPADVLFGKHSTGICLGDSTNDTISGQDAAGCSSLQYSLGLTSDSLIAASLDLYLRDDADPGNNPETVRITVNGVSAGQYSVVNSPFNVDVLATVSSDGLLNVFLDRGSQGIGQADFYFDKSILRAEWQQAESQVSLLSVEAVTAPEPTTLLLIGAGLASAAFRRRLTRD